MAKVRSSADQLIGLRIRERRNMLGLTQLQFSQLLGVTNQQVHKYERGINSISAGQLYEIASGSSTPIAYFFEGLEKEDTKLPPRLSRLLDLMRSLTEMENGKHLEAISQLTRALAGN